ncbi:g1878 [Coccomyxa viridis]|uniref:G1878 protein n=1 Tax=Coccomyxa viridis TaxID=1274662 RepID=A0ABP1FJ27_9CHLO
MDSGTLSATSVLNKVSVPFSDCSVEEAKHFLSAIYSFRAHDHIDKDCALSIARLSHKYDVVEMVNLCDNAIAETAGFNADVNNFPAYLKDQELESFLHIMKCATVFGMPKLLAYFLPGPKEFFKMASADKKS